MAELGGPFVIAGADRSGLGLIGEMLERHPSLAISRRTNLWTFYLDRFGDLSEPGNLDRCLDAMLSFTRIRAMHPDRPRLVRDFVEGGDHSYFALFRLLGSSYAESIGKTRWGDKSLNSERDAGRVLEAYPDAVMIHVVRDPRDRHASMMHHRGGRRSGVLGSIAVWANSARLAARNAARFPGRYLVVRYEDLVADPEQQLRRILDLVGEPFDRSVLEIDAVDVGDQSHPGGTVPRALTGSSIGRFERDVSAREVAVIERALRLDMTRLGYDLSRPALGVMAELRVRAVDRPTVAVWSVLWRRWSAVKRRYASGPSRRRLVSDG